MQTYILNRILLMFPTLLAISLIVFASIRLLPGGALDERLAEAGVPAADRAKIRAEYGFDRPIVEQYVSWVGGLVRGDLGKSLFHHETVNQRILSALPVTLELGLLALLLSVAAGIPVGVLSALLPASAPDLIFRSVAIAALSVPSFWIATLVLVLPAIWWGWIPPHVYVPFRDAPLQNLAVFGLPAGILALRLGAVVMRMMRSQTLEVIRSDYVRTARAKGLTEYRVVTRHVLKNAAISVVTILGLSIANLLGGSVIMETIFSMPGLGRLMITAIREREFDTVQSVILIEGVFVMVVNLAIDLLYGYLNPRIRED